jgi:hypothetical protein
MFKITDSNPRHGSQDLIKKIRIQRDKEFLNFFNNPSAESFALFCQQRDSHWNDPNDYVNQLNPNDQEEEKKRDKDAKEKAGKIFINTQNMQTLKTVLRS